jgi:hypothetical protein
VALEAEVVREVEFIVCQIDVLDAAPTLNGAYRISFSVSKALNAGGGILQGRGGHTLWIKVPAENVLQVPIMNKHLRVGGHKKGELSAHVMDRLSKVRLSNLVKLVEIGPCPELDSSIPTAGNHDCLVVLMEHVEVLDWLRMRANVDDLIARQIPLLDVIVRASKQYSDLVDAPDSTEYRGTPSGPLQHDLSLSLVSHSRKLGLIDDHVSVPKARKEECTTELLVDLREWSEL